MENSIIEELIGGMPSWTEEANCKGADADIFFPERGASTRKAKEFMTQILETLVKKY